MLEPTTADVQAAFASAKNLNAALKNFLKREGKGGKTVETFAKGFRSAVSGGRQAALEYFVESNYPQKKLHFAALMQYAYPDLRDSIVPPIFEKHAEAFNATYEKDGDEVRVTDAARFKAIAADVVAMIEDGISGAGLSKNSFVVFSLLALVFEPGVFEKVIEVL